MSCCASVSKKPRQSPPASPSRASSGPEPSMVADAHSLSGTPNTAAALALLSEGEIAAACAGSGATTSLSAGVQSHFYQKFENEQEGRQKAMEDLSKRQQMLSLIHGGEWVLEVSLKHSGSLGHYDGEVMWSKNSVDNAYTAAFENLLFDCFRRGFPLTEQGTAAAADKFQRFSQVLREETLTVAFEGVCRGILGDHGQTPKLNYLVVTAVVDKGAPFARRFRDTHGVSCAHLQCIKCR